MKRLGALVIASTVGVGGTTHARAEPVAEAALAELALVYQRHSAERGIGARLYVAATGRPFDATLLGGRAFTAVGAQMARVRLWAPRQDGPELVAGSQVTFGLEVRLGLRWPSGRYVFLGAGPIVSRVSPHNQAAAAVLEPLGHHRGFRAGFGGSGAHAVLAGTWERVDRVDRWSVSVGFAL